MNEIDKKRGHPEAIAAATGRSGRRFERPRGVRRERAWLSEGCGGSSPEAAAGGDLPLLDEGDIFHQEPEHAFA